MAGLRVVDVADAATFELIPPCADPQFDHRTCDYWENADRGSKASRPGLLTGPRTDDPRSNRAANPFAHPGSEPPVNPFAPDATLPENPFAPPPRTAVNPFAPSADSAAPNPFAAARPTRTAIEDDAPLKLRLLSRGLRVFGSYAKVLLVDDVSVAYAQFGPLSAYPRALRTRDLYPQLPEAPLPAVISCIATTPEARRQGHAKRLVDAVCDDLAGRGFSAIEA